MNARTRIATPLLASAIASLLMVACSSSPTKPDAASGARQKLTQLQNNPQLASRAPIAIEEAVTAVNAAEVPRKDTALTDHLVFIADRKVDTAVALAQSRMLVDHRKVLSDERDSMRLQARTNEADRAHMATNRAVAEADAARDQAGQAMRDADAARMQNAELQRQVAELNARETDRGLVVTLGDVLFATGRAELKGGATSNLSKLAAFLNQYPDRTVAIEGHTDSVGSEDSNMGLSQRRADSVKSYLIGQGIAAYRINALGKGEGYPVSGNDSATGRQQNRRVEVIIANAVAAR